MLNEANLPFSYVIEGNKTVPEIVDVLDVALEVTNNPSPHFGSTVKFPMIIGLSVQGEDDNTILLSLYSFFALESGNVRSVIVLTIEISM